VQARLAATQAALETGFGRSAPGNNYFGIKGPGQRQATTEAQNGALQAINASFRTYPDLPGSIQGWWNTIQQNWPSAATASDFPTAINALNNGRYGSYASDKVESNDPLTYQDKLAAINRQYLPQGAGSVGKNVAGVVGGMVPFAAPAPLTPESMQSGSPLDKLPQSAMYGLQRRLTPGQVTAPPTDFTTQDTGSPDLRLLGLSAPKVPTADVVDPSGSLSWNMLQDFADSGTKAPSVPTPFPTPNFALPQVPTPP